jgi:ubiquinone/menaquinone biosynthesis C-methylase UbiE
MTNVAEIHNEMAEEYDEIHDLWYAWLFSRLHYIIAKYVINVHNPKTVLDVGCGTGFQSFLHASAGAKVTGIDIAEKLIMVAMNKTLSYDPCQELFPAYFKFVNDYNKLIGSLLKNKLIDGSYLPPTFLVADATKLPFENESFEHINCCGSTLSFIEDHQQALAEMARALKRDGTLLLEVESRWNLDVLWTIFDSVFCGHLGYDTSLREALRSLLTFPQKYVYIEYPFGDPDDSLMMKLKLFTKKKLTRELNHCDLTLLKSWSIHSITNFIPSTYLDMKNPNHRLLSIFKFLSKIEERMPLSLPGCSLILFAQKNIPKRIMTFKRET